MAKVKLEVFMVPWFPWFLEWYPGVVPGSGRLGLVGYLIVSLSNLLESLLA